MANVDWLKELRSAGVKRAVFSEQNPNGEAKLLEVEFFPRTLLDVSAFADGADPMEAPTEPPPPPSAEEPQMKVAPAMSRVLRQGSVS